MVDFNTALTDMLARRRDRSISIVLSTKERECDQYLPKEARSRLRKVILDQINDLVDFMMDMTSSLDTGEVVLNDLYLQKLSEIHDLLVGSQNGI